MPPDPLRALWLRHLHGINYLVPVLEVCTPPPLMKNPGYGPGEQKRDLMVNLCFVRAENCPNLTPPPPPPLRTFPCPHPNPTAHAAIYELFIYRHVFRSLVQSCYSISLTAVNDCPREFIFQPVVPSTVVPKGCESRTQKFTQWKMQILTLLVASSIHLNLLVAVCSIPLLFIYFRFLFELI